MNSTVFSCCQKVASDCTSLTEDGREFQAWAAATGNARSPRVRRRAGGATSVDVSADRRRRWEYSSLSVARSRRGTMALYHEGIGRPEHRAKMLSSPELSTNGIHGVAE